VVTFSREVCLPCCLSESWDVFDFGLFGTRGCINISLATSSVVFVSSPTLVTCFSEARGERDFAISLDVSVLCVDEITPLALLLAFVSVTNFFEIDPSALLPGVDSSE